MSNLTEKYDLIIIGAGLAGTTAACALARHSIEILVIESADITKIRKKLSDGRTCAISHGSAEIFKNIGVWEQMAKNAGPINDIRVTDCDSSLFLHYDHKLVGNNPMGYIIENYYIREALFEKANEYQNIEIIDNTKWQDIKRNESEAIVKLENGITAKSSLLIAADGRGSKVRENAEIDITNWSYNQAGIVCTIKHEKVHNQIAQEKFLPSGPFAILPMKDEYHSSIVWTEKLDLVSVFCGVEDLSEGVKMDDAEFIKHLTSRFGDYLGKLELASPRYFYPLSLVQAKKYTDKRLALIGDAAHGIHPIAGQGFNLGIRDVCKLDKVIEKQCKNGLDIGASSILKEYEALRKFDSMSLIMVTDLLNRLFLNENAKVKIARRVGIAAVNKITPLKKFFMKHAMGVYS